MEVRVARGDAAPFPPQPPVLSEFMRLLTQLGGYNNRVQELPPAGPQSLWVGLRRMTDFATAWLAFGPQTGGGVVSKRQGTEVRLLPSRSRQFARPLARGTAGASPSRAGLAQPQFLALTRHSTLGHLSEGSLLGGGRRDRS